MRFRNIEVSGIERIVFNRETEWRLETENLWRKVVKGDYPDHMPTPEYRTHDNMMAIVNALKKDRRFRMWVHFDTLNILWRDKNVKSEVGK